MIREGPIVAFVGTAKLNGQEDENACEITVERVIIHPKYDEFMHDNDIAIVVLNDEIEFNERAKPIELPSQGDEVSENDEGVFSGWGLYFSDGHGAMSSTLRYAQVKVVDIKRCKEVYIRWITDNMICAGLPKVTPCFGDYGGPLVVQNVLHGIMSWNSACGAMKYPGVSTKVSNYIQWIESNIGKL